MLLDSRLILRHFHSIKVVWICVGNTNALVAVSKGIHVVVEVCSGNEILQFSSTQVDLVVVVILCKIRA